MKNHSEPTNSSGDSMQNRGELKTVSEIAQLFDLRSDVVRQMIQDGCPVAVRGTGGRNGNQLSTAEFYHWNMDRARRHRVGRPPTGDDTPNAKEREQAAKAEMAELRLAEARGELISQAALDQIAEEIATEIRMQFIAFIQSEWGQSGVDRATEFLNGLAAQLQSVADNG